MGIPGISLSIQKAVAVNNIVYRGFVYLKGPDVLSLLQGLLTCDIRHIQGSSKQCLKHCFDRSQESVESHCEPQAKKPSKKSCTWVASSSPRSIDLATPRNDLYGFLLTPNGRFAFDVFIIPFEEGYLLDVYDKDNFIIQLKRYRLNRQVEIIDYPGYVGWSKEKPDAGIYYPDIRFYGYHILLENPPSPSSLDEYNYERIKNGISDPPLDLIPGKGIILEHRLPKDAISYDKGCYIGQEFISRTYYLGVLRKKVLPYQIIKGIVQYGDQLKDDLGQVLSVIKDVCLVRANEDAFEKEDVETLNGAFLKKIDLR